MDEMPESGRLILWVRSPRCAQLRHWGINVLTLNFGEDTLFKIVCGAALSETTPSARELDKLRA